MEYNLKGKNVLVTGAAGGIGASVVKHLLDEDVKHIAMLDVSTNAGRELENKFNEKYMEKKVKFITCDVTDKQKMIETFKTLEGEYGSIDVVVNSAAILNETFESYVMQINVNLVGLVTSCLLAWNLMHKEKGGNGGTIINLNSIGSLRKLACVPINSAVTSGVLKFSTSLGDETHFSKSGVRVLVICIGVTDTPMIRNIEKKMFDESAVALIEEDLKLLKVQSPVAAANAVMQVYKHGTTGSVWLSTSGRPALDITDTFNKSIELFNDYILK